MTVTTSDNNCKNGDITIFIHSHVKTFLQTASLALISMCLINNARPSAGLTSIYKTSSYTPFKKT